MKINAESIIKELEELMYKEVISIKDEKTAFSCTNALFDCLYLNFKSRLMYVPSLNKKDTEKQCEAIYTDYENNFSYQELAVKYHRSVQNIYAITKKLKKKQIRKYQSDLFPLPPEDEAKKPITIFILEQYLPSELVHCGLSKKQSKVLSKKIANHLCTTFPGVSITISNAMKKNRADKNQTSLF